MILKTSIPVHEKRTKPLSELCGELRGLATIYSGIFLRRFDFHRFHKNTPPSLNLQNGIV